MMPSLYTVKTVQSKDKSFSSYQDKKNTIVGDNGIYSRSAIDYVEKAQNKPDDYDFLFMFLGSDVGFVRSAGHLLSTFIYNDSKEICPHNNSP